MNKFKYILLFSLLFVSLPLSANAFQMQGCGSDCASCHSLTKEEAAELIKADALKAQVLKVDMAPVKGLWEVQVYHDNTISSVYIDFAKKNLVQAEFTPLDKIAAKEPELPKVDLKQIPLDNAIVMGDKNAKYKIIVFSDPDCPFCREEHQDIKKILAERKDIVFYIKLFPLDMHPDAYNKSKTIQCSKSPEVLDNAFSGKELPKTDCDTKEIDKNRELAAKLGIRGTPTLILPDGRMIRSAVNKFKLYNLLGIK